MNGQVDELRRLGMCVVARRKQLGMKSRRALARRAGLSYRVLGDIERGSRSVAPGTYAMLEQALEWPPGTVERIRRGGQPPVEADDDIVGHLIARIVDGVLVVWEAKPLKSIGHARSELSRVQELEDDRWEILELRRTR